MENVPLSEINARVKEIEPKLEQLPAKVAAQPLSEIGKRLQKGGCPERSQEARADCEAVGRVGWINKVYGPKRSGSNGF